jgi:hypothetical protein
MYPTQTVISTPNGGHVPVQKKMEATLLILDLLNLPSQAPQHAKLITVMEDEAFASTSQSSHA